MPGAACPAADGPGDPRALRQTLRVAGVADGRVQLEADRLSGCAHCAARAGCGTGALAELTGGGPVRIDLPGPASVRPGDHVVVSMPGGAFLGAAGLAYLLPPAALVLAAGLFAALGLPDLMVAALCLPVLLLSLLPARRADRRGRLAAAMRIEEVIPAPDRGAP
ncbi:SoxR reducing system RseC family protein [Rhodovulum adriaticum]|uniref:RseC/MucC-like positive regulator of sigma(E) n=2 Tax=Rhodovulum adriaticum TaxID=35804 RepID=A0A4R2NKH6_RHOAD|nr:SoxR reducing system RseC family protein [Rhodovulum adriaticum]MBK1635446.1 hypothetical protein [Rhodovulum adriaticum]TCP22017.1 RseC/MucC-like positive regulator of sigma(E) [Rhodovulum adriaticum]